MLREYVLYSPNLHLLTFKKAAGRAWARRAVDLQTTLGKPCWNLPAPGENVKPFRGPPALPIPPPEVGSGQNGNCTLLHRARERAELGLRLSLHL